MSDPTCPHCGAAQMRVNRLSLQFKCGTKTSYGRTMGGRALDCYATEANALREQNERVTKERDEARIKRDQWRECAARPGVMLKESICVDAVREPLRQSALETWSKLEGSAS